MEVALQDIGNPENEIENSLIEGARFHLRTLSSKIAKYLNLGHVEVIVQKSSEQIADPIQCLLEDSDTLVCCEISEVDIGKIANIHLGILEEESDYSITNTHHDMFARLSIMVSNSIATKDANISHKAFTSSGVVVCIKVTSQSASFDMQITIDKRTIETLLQTQLDTKSDNKVSPEIFHELEFELDAVLGQTKLTANQAASIKVGDFIPLSNLKLNAPVKSGDVVIGKAEFIELDENTIGIKFK
ncbi:FliM/FliN family flagellar motor C-terminal domain-containing protein [Vibrio barjaei]|uniref:FliM/FliN family flagellar motor C-terminal domain-containing protein n=1 Tax=Vibrio barjaei TaxID=1676683 RepID=UPI00228405E5|nr:FliM/FliN family flagellar motor C-terminal domain-containing protein [Vibrio barjaei]MCY9872321.1 FliM/FliN family flagellar motor C-terminal domain-containing protein [Vibrio barjaei]